MRKLSISFMLAFLLAGCSGDEGKSCLINETRACLGPGGCSGVQSCVDGASYTVCQCGSSQQDGAVSQQDSGGTARDGGATQTDSSVSNPGKSPKILSLTSNITTFSPGQSLIISAIVTDPQGIDDLIGGKLEHPGGGTYGTFATSSQEGAYSLTLDWGAINTVAPINAPVAGAARLFRARFYDVAGNEVTKDLSVKLLCGNSKTACTGNCYDLQTTSSNCGKCGFSCSAVAQSGSSYSCVAGACKLKKTLYTDKDKSQTCNAACATISFSCTEASWMSWCCTGKCASPTCSLSATAASINGCSIGYAKCVCEKTVKP